jgi:hypothetical protein
MFNSKFDDPFPPISNTLHRNHAKKVGFLNNTTFFGPYGGVEY